MRDVAGWNNVAVDTTVGRVFKEVSEKQISQFENVTYKLRGPIWRQAIRAGVSKVGLNPVQWVDVDSTVDSVCGIQEGAAKGYNPKKKGALSYHPQLAFLAGSKEILQAWFRTGNAYTSNGIVEFVKQLLAHLPNRMRVIIRADSGYFVGDLLDLLDARGHGYLLKVACYLRRDELPVKSLSLPVGATPTAFSRDVGVAPTIDFYYCRI